MTLKLDDLKHLPKLNYRTMPLNPRAVEIAELTWANVKMKKNRAHIAIKSLMYVAGICENVPGVDEPMLVLRDSINFAGQLPQRSLNRISFYLNYKSLGSI